ncbi:hypothetical protein COLO4_29545 [Corchorus olitorius]|uniref:Protein transport protein sec16 n=1 Tax=Corchorus olitorius TaxID=93759 RepID=A0A1R3HE43_9ROSI|nr:hypothetical protein COLO4_29545 [Corchorus olitorius]
MASPPFEAEDQVDEDFFDKLVNDDDDFDFTVSNRSSVVQATDSGEVKAFSNLTISETTPAGVDFSFEAEKETGAVGEDGGNSALLDSNEDVLVANESSCAVPSNVSDSSEKGAVVEHVGISTLVHANEDALVADESCSAVPSNAIDSSEKGAIGEHGGVSTLLHGSEDVLVANESSSAVPSNVNESSDKGMVEEGLLDSGTSKIDSVASDNGVKEVQWSSFNSDSNVNSGGGFRTYSEYFNDLGDNSEDPFAEVGNKDDLATEFNATAGVLENSVSDLASSTYLENNDVQYYGVGSEQNVDGQDLSNSQYWENPYPGWRYDPNTGQWYQVEGYDANAATNSQESWAVTQSVGDDLISNQKVDGHSLQQTAQSVMGNLAEDFGNSNESNWNQISQGNAEYPAHMVFDPQYPGWYYDTIAQEWKMLESYTPAADHSATIDYNQQYQNKNVESYESQALGSQDHVINQGESASNCHRQNSTILQAYSVSNRGTEVSSETKQLGNLFGSVGLVDHPAQPQNGIEPSRSIAQYDQPSQSFLNNGEVSQFQSPISAHTFPQFNNQTIVQPDQQVHFMPASVESQKPGNYSQQPFQFGTSFSPSPYEGRSSAGRPPHALVTFGFGGKLIVMRNNDFSPTSSVYGSQGSVGGGVNVLNLIEVVMHNSEAPSFGFGAHDYFHKLCYESFPGPLVGGNSGNKELYKWIDERIASYESSSMGYSGEVLRLLFSLLKISCQHYGKLRSPFGSDQTLKESDYPELAIAKLLGSVKGKGVESIAYGTLKKCLQNLPSEAQMQATALEVQKLLVSGRKKEALEFAQEGQLWGPALVIASQLGQPAEVFSSVSSGGNVPGYITTPNQPGQIGANMLDAWEENLAVITANRTKDDELVIIHLGDCLWKERGEVAAAHICYLVAEANFEPYSDGARLCLVGADHWNCPRTYVSPEAIQRTELYEYSKVQGNPQFLLLPFQPYKLIYAYMLAEVGKVAESLKYCQAILKSSKTGRAAEVETWKQLVSSLEERLRIHQQGGYNTNLASAKLVGKLLTFFDNTAQRVVGGPPPPLPLTSYSSVHSNGFAHQPGGPKTSSSQQTMALQTLMSPVSIESTIATPSLIPSSSVESTMAMASLIPSASVESTMAMSSLMPSASVKSTMMMPSLMPSASMEPISEWTGQTDLSAMPSRSISEPVFGQSDGKVNSSNEVKSSGTQEKPVESSGSSRFGRFGSQIFQKTFGLVLKSRAHRQAKLGETNKFYYDEKLKRWVEEGAEPPAEEAALPPPPPSASFQNGMNDLSIKDTPKSESLHTSGDNKSPISSEGSSGIPPMPPSSNQYSARARIGVRSRYVDTFNKGGGSPVNLFQTPSVPSAKPVAGSSPKFFIPSPVTPNEDVVKNTGESMDEAALTNENPATSFKPDFSPLPSSSTSTSASSVPLSASSVAMQRFPSMDNIVHKRVAAAADNDSRRIASWSGSLSDASNLSTSKGLKPPGEAFRTSPSFYADPNSREDLHEIKL